MFKLIFDIYQHTFSFKMQVVGLSRPNKIIACLIHITNHIVVTAIQIAEVRIIRILL